MSVRKDLTAFIGAAIRCDDLDEVSECAATVADAIANGEHSVDLVVPAASVREFCATIAALRQGR